MCLAQYFCELALTICPREQKADSFLSLVLNSLYLLSENKRSADLIKPCLEMRLASMAGYMPDLRMCRECGEYITPLMYFLPRIGALECADCRTDVSEPAIALNEERSRRLDTRFMPMMTSCFRLHCRRMTLLC